MKNSILIERILRHQIRALDSRTCPTRYLHLKIERLKDECPHLEYLAGGGVCSVCQRSSKRIE